MKRNHIPSFVILITMVLMLNCVCIPTSAYADEFSHQVKRFIAEMADSIWERNDSSVQRLKIGVGNFNYLDTQMASPFAVYLVDEIDAALVADKRFKVIARKELDEFLKEYELQITDIINPNTTVGIGKIEGVDAILVGSYGEWGKEVRVSAKMIEVERGEKLASKTTTIKDIPKNVPIKPVDHDAMKVQIEKLSNLLPERPESPKPQLNPKFQKNSDFDIRAWVDRGAGGLYKKGEEMTVYLKSELDCYVEIYDIYPDGSTHRIFPNEYRQDNFIRRDKLYELPRKIDPFTFEITPPFGVEKLKVLASTVPFPKVEKGVYKNKGAFPEIGKLNNPKTITELKSRAKGVAVKPKAKVAQNLCVFTTVE